MPKLEDTGKGRVASLGYQFDKPFAHRELSLNNLICIRMQPWIKNYYNFSGELRESYVSDTESLITIVTIMFLKFIENSLRC